MYTIDVSIKGVVALLQHKYGKTALDEAQERTKKRTAKPDYSKEWMDTMYAEDGYIVQPAIHIEGALVKGATRFTIPGQGKRTYKDPVRAFCYVMPDNIPHLWNGEYIPEPGAELIEAPTDALSVSIMRVVVSRSAVARARLMIAPGWELRFQIEVHDDVLQPDEIYKSLEMAGQSIGIGDFRPRYGRFVIQEFTPNGRE